MDAVTGTIICKTTWPFGRTSISRIPSPLESALKSHNIQWTPAFTFLHNTHYTVLGRATMYECGQAPPIYTYKDVFFLYAPTTAELQALVLTLQTGSPQQQEQALNAIADKAFANSAATQPTTAP